jgi:hypothetical protein
MFHFMAGIRRLFSTYWFKGILIGETFWLISFAALWIFTVLVEKFDIDSAILETLATVSAVIVLPVLYGGFLFLWGDYPPKDWVNDLSFNIVFSLFLYAALGAGIGRLFSKTKSTPSVK